VATSGVHWGRLALTAGLLHFLELEPEVELLGSEYNADLTGGCGGYQWGPLGAVGADCRLVALP
jgi:hypothetical protein